MLIAILLIFAVISLLVDMLQTLDIKHRPEMQETEIILGEHPTDKKIISYFIICVCALIGFVLWVEHVNPGQRISEIFCMIVLLIESFVIYKNHKIGLKI